MMKVTFIQHSSFLAELDHCCLLFDYYGERSKNASGKTALHLC